MHRGRASFSHRQMRPVRAGDVRPRNWPWRWTSPPRSTLRPFPLESSCPPVSVPPQPLPAYAIQRHARTSAQAAVDVPVQDSRYCVFVGTASSLIVSESSIIGASSSTEKIATTQSRSHGPPPARHSSAPRDRLLAVQRSSESAFASNASASLVGSPSCPQSPREEVSSELAVNSSQQADAH